MDHLIESVFVDSEGRALAQTMAALEAGDTERLRQVDLELGALRPAREVRRASRAIGRRMLAIYGSIANDDFAPIARSLPEGNAATAYGAVFFHARVTMTDALLGFGYGRLAGTVSAAIRLMPLGHEEGQKLLTGRLGQLPEAAARIVANVDEPLRSFGPGLDVEQMNHQYVYSRLFRS
jgi:urease accessory protein